MKAPLAVVLFVVLASAACGTTQRAGPGDRGMTNVMPQSGRSCIPAESDATCNYGDDCCSGHCANEGGLCQ